MKRKRAVHHWSGLDPNPEKYLGFVYLIQHVPTGKKYIGKKQFWLANGMKRGCRSKITDRSSDKWKEMCWRESDWRTYSGSSRHLTSFMAEHDKSEFDFIILKQFFGKADLHYGEVKEQISRDVLFTKSEDGTYEYFNKSISAIRFRPPNKVDNDEGTMPDFLVKHL